MSETRVKQKVREFYDQVGWQTVSDGLYQNARYEDLRPVSREYIHRCHLRVNRHLAPQGRFLLDAGSGPVQYPEYLTYSQGYRYRVCADISILALREARKRLGDHGLFVVADVANLPFRADVFEGVVSLHTLHHLPLNEQKQAYHELYRVLTPGRSLAVVNGWTDSPLMRRFGWLVNLMETIGKWIARLRGKEKATPRNDGKTAVPVKATPTGTFVEKLDAAWLRRELAELSPQIWVWRSVSVRFLRAVIHRLLAGRLWLRLLYALEERFPHYFGEKGQYPLIVIDKPKGS
ncbi:methylase [Bellilinea caldifistulae]|uniref:class I SAM-dependent methyltransferase n=1 Tax=Bellilinea caldifistulae TaxID=360411 RepID=UPI000780B80E|nr:class I SAM-dependent methyltransferase [Bellilinea caldifistulae]GAP09507.1 methylase [Bellilinea caldifistulae]